VLGGAGRSIRLSGQDAAQLGGVLVGIPIQRRLEVKPICVIGVTGHLALQNGAIALRCPAFVKGIQHRAEEGRHASSNGCDVEASLPWADICVYDDSVSAPDSYNSILTTMFPERRIVAA
jgi:hypothetical protein